MNEAQKRAVEITGDFLANFARRVLRGETDCIEAETLSLLHLQREAGVCIKRYKVMCENSKSLETCSLPDVWRIQSIVEETE